MGFIDSLAFYLFFTIPLCSFFSFLLSCLSLLLLLSILVTTSLLPITTRFSMHGSTISLLGIGCNYICTETVPSLHCPFALHDVMYTSMYTSSFLFLSLWRIQDTLSQHFTTGTSAVVEYNKAVQDTSDELCPARMYINRVIMV